jgi:hypothetical protein
VFGHVATTLAITLALSSIGGSLLSESAYRIFSSMLLMLLGAYYLYTYVVRGERTSACCDAKHPPPPHLPPAGEKDDTTSTHNVDDARLREPILPASTSGPVVSETQRVAENRAATISVISLTALSPCLGSMPVLLALATPPIDWLRVAAAALVLALTSAAVMCCLIATTFVGAARLDFARVRRHERLILGAGLVLLAALTFVLFSKPHHHHHHGQHVMPGGGMNAMGGTSGDV